MKVPSLIVSEFCLMQYALLYAWSALPRCSIWRSTMAPWLSIIGDSLIGRALVLHREPVGVAP